MLALRILLLGATFASALAAQSTRISAPRRFGLLGGINLSTFAGGDQSGTENHTGFLLGASFLYPINDNWSIQSEGVYTTKGAETSDNTGSGSLLMNYFEAPLLLRFDVPVAGTVRPFLYAGPAVSYQFSCDVEGQGGGVTLSMTCAEFDRQFGSGNTVFNTVDFGVALGGGLAFDVSGRILTVGARYTAGFVTITEDSDSKNRVLTFLLRSSGL